MVSNCCGAEIIENTDLCSDCKEHCDVSDCDVSDFDNAMCLDGKKITYNGKVVKHENK
jgi:hypothetical protein